MKKAWKLLDGKKTWLGGAAFFVLYGLRGFNVIDEAMFNTLAGVVFVVTGFGLGHKMFKWAK